MKKVMKQWTQIMMVVLFMVLAMNTKVFAADNSGTSFETAGNLSIGGEAYGSLTKDGGNRYFTFTTSSNKSWYRITGINSSCDEAIKLVLYNTDKAQVEASGGIDEHSTGAIIKELTPNTKYYVTATTFWSAFKPVGNFKLTLSEIVDDYGDTDSTSKAISMGQTIAGHIDAEDDVDFFRFNTSSEKNCYYFIDVINIDSTSLKYELYNTDMVCVYSGYTYDQASQRTITEKLDPDSTYYFKVYGKTGKYKIKLNKAADEAADEFGQATKIELNKTYNYGIQAYGDVDYFKFKTNKTDKEYTIQIAEKTSGKSVNFKLYDANQQQQGYAQTIYSGSSYKEKWTLNKNKVYYIRMDGDVSNYSVKVSCASGTKYSITYNLNGGKNNSGNPATYTGNQTVKLKSPAKKGYKFAGWYTDKSFKKSISTIKAGSGKNYTLYAKWTKINLSKASIKSLKKSGSGKAKVVVNKVKTADGYEIVTAANKKMTSGKKTTTMSSTSKTLSLKKGKTYYVKVRAFSVDSTGKKIYGKYSAVKQLKL